jgi:AcrR family transcriptional regulator
VNDDRGSEAPVVGRVARNRQRRSRQFLTAAQRIVTHEGFEALTMSRLSDELDSAVSSVYRYFPSKGHLVRAVQAEAIERLTQSYDLSVEDVVTKVARRVPAGTGLVRLVVLGRWFCSAAEVLPEDVRLLQMVASQRNSMLDPDGGMALMAPSLELLGRVMAALEQAEAEGSIRPAPALPRTAMWGSALGGTLAADDFERYIPDVFGGGRMARQLNVDLLVGWGADPEAVAQIDAEVDRLAAKAPLARTAAVG